MSKHDAILALIAEMRAKACDPQGGALTAELCSIVLQNVLPMVEMERPVIVCQGGEAWA